MRFKAIIPCLLLILVAPLWAQDDPSKLTEEERRQRAEELMALQRPGPEHQLLLDRVGTWQETVKLWMNPKAENPIVIEGTTTWRPVLGDRFVVLEGEAGEGQFKSEKMTILGFDRRHGHYTMTSYDTWGTYGVSATGTFDQETGKLTLSGQDEDPVLKMTQKYDFVFRFPSEDEYVMELYFKDPSHGNSEPFKMVEVTGQRVDDD